MKNDENSNGASETTIKNCIFCKIVKKEIPAKIVYEDNDFLAFLDINPVSNGHLLLIPKSHHTQMSETPDELVGKLFIRAKNIMPRLKKVMCADFVAMTVVGTDVPHLHIHLIPRKNDDGLAGFWPTQKYENNERMLTISEKIKSSLEK